MVSTSNVITAYNRELLKAGYKARFMIHLHKAKRAGDHWDLRLEFPVESVADSLKHYEGKRDPDSDEPLNDFPDKPGTVYRSFVTKKMKAPSGKDKIYLIETEDHPIAYGSFRGTISEGYGAGEVEIYDKGNYELLDVDGDKKYIINFKGKKLNGTYALIKYQKGYLWVKTKESKKASAIDYPRPTMNPRIWNLDGPVPKLKPYIRSEILSLLIKTFEENGLSKPFRFIKHLTLSGSMASNNYTETTDVDVDIQYDGTIIRAIYPKTSRLSDDEIYEYIKKIVDKVNDKPVSGTTSTYSFMVLKEGDHPAGDNLYDILNDKWIKGFNFVPLDFDPDRAFIRQKMIALSIAADVDMTIARILSIIADMKKVDLYNRYHNNKLQAKRILFMYDLKKWCEKLDDLYNYIWSLQKDAKNERGGPSYVCFNYSPNWDERMIILKYLARYGYHRPIVKLYKQLKGDPYLKLVDKFIPD